jgi:alpha-aminoadipate/glutamate carrier protein LysW
VKKLNIAGYPECGGKSMVYCPECETDLDIEEDEVDEGAVVSCPECGSDFEVITVNPIELKMVGEDEVEEEEEEEEESKKDEEEEEEEF